MMGVHTKIFFTYNAPPPPPPAAVRWPPPLSSPLHSFVFVAGSRKYQVHQYRPRYHHCLYYCLCCPPLRDSYYPLRYPYYHPYYHPCCRRRRCF